MLVKIIMILVLMPSICYASLGKVVTQAQLNKYCVPVRLSIDGDVHWFHYKSIKILDTDGIDLVYGNKTRHFSPQEVLNYGEAKLRYDTLKAVQP